MADVQPSKDPSNAPIEEVTTSIEQEEMEQVLARLKYETDGLPAPVEEDESSDD